MQMLSQKKSIEVTEGPISRGNDYYPHIYITQTDIAGPFLAPLNHSKSKTVKIWLAGFSVQKRI